MYTLHEKLHRTNVTCACISYPHTSFSIPHSPIPKQVNVWPNEEGATDPKDLKDSVKEVPINIINNYFSIGADAQVALEFHLGRGIYTCTLYIYIYMYTCICTCIHMHVYNNIIVHDKRDNKATSVCVCVCVCVQRLTLRSSTIESRTNSFTQRFVCMCMCLCVCMCVCVYHCVIYCI